MTNESFDVVCSDCLDALRGMESASVDAVVTDPPYGLSFMGKKWDYDVPSVEVWAECLRVLKPGGHLLAFAGTRTQHRMAVRIEDAGFDIRDMIAWVYGSGFPKSLDVSKAIDKGEGENRVRQLRFVEWMRSTGITAKQIKEATGTDMANHYLTKVSQPAIATADLFDKMRSHLPEVPEDIERLVAERTGIEWTAYKNREVLSTETRYNEASGIVSAGRDDRTLIERKITAPATAAARAWEGWGTALKPALEPITVARKPLVGTVAANVMAHGTGALNIDGCRVGTVAPQTTRGANALGRMNDDGWEPSDNGQRIDPHPAGRWPANLIHDGSEEVLPLFPQGALPKAARFGQRGGSPLHGKHGMGTLADIGYLPADEGGSAARFFYCAKASKADREDGMRGTEPKAAGVGDERMNKGAVAPRCNTHPTVKPTDLMRYLCRLVTPRGGLILDPFCGSGSTGRGAVLEGFRFVGIEREAEYAEIARRRIAAAVDRCDLFGAAPR